METHAGEERTPFSYLFMHAYAEQRIKFILLPFRLIIIAVILVGNATTARAIFKFHRLQTKTNLILCSLSISDFCVGISLLGFTIRTMLFSTVTCPLGSSGGTFSAS
jgi:hypothetical protein